MSKLARIGAVAALGVMVTGCGSSSDRGTAAEDAAPTTSTSSEAPKSAAGEPVKDKPTSSEPSEVATIISIADFEFEGPETVAPGAKITVENGDSTSHTVTSSDGDFDVTIEGDASATFTAPAEPGQYDYVCNFHGDMTGTLVVK